MKLISDYRKQPLEEWSVESSLDLADFDTEDAYCEELSSGVGPTEVEIVGLELLMEDGNISDLVDPSYVDSSDSDSSDEERVNTLSCVIDSLELSRERLPHLGAQKNSRPKRRKPRRLHKRLPAEEEEDSLVLTRGRLAHLSHKMNRIERLQKFYREGRGLMGEVDSLALDRKRLSNIVIPRATKSSKMAVVAENIMYIKAKRRLTQSTKKLYNDITRRNEMHNSKLETDTDSTTSTDTASSLGSVFSTNTVDSLILTRMHLAKDHERSNKKKPPADFKRASLVRGDSERKKMPPQRRDEGGLHVRGLQCSTSNACAA